MSRTTPWSSTTEKMGRLCKKRLRRTQVLLSHRRQNGGRTQNSVATGQHARSCHSCLSASLSGIRRESHDRISHLVCSGHHEYPAIFIRGQHIQGGTYKIGQAYKSGELEHWVSDDDDGKEAQTNDEGLLEIVVRT